MHLRFFSDFKEDRFYPLTLTRPVEELRVGILTITEKWMIQPGASSYSHHTPYVPCLDEAHVLPGPDDDLIYWVNSGYLPDMSMDIGNLKSNQGYFDKERPVLVALPKEDSLNDEEGALPDFSSCDKIPLNGKPSNMQNVWDILSQNHQEILRDIERLGAKPIQTQKYPQVHFSNPENIYAESGVTIEPGAILIADHGPIYLGKDCTVEAGAILKGSVAVGNSATVKMGARIYGGTTIGPHCKAGGEISNSVFHSYSNKAHDGFVGNSLFGQWCNLGADTNTSNLKNNYSPVRLPNRITGEETETGLQFLGTVMGDHSKTAINTMLNTGTICGVCANIFVSGFPPKLIPSFSWMGDSGNSVYRFEKAVEAISAMMERRGIEPSDPYIAMLKDIFQSEEELP